MDRGESKRMTRGKVYYDEDCSSIVRGQRIRNNGPKRVRLQIPLGVNPTHGIVEGNKPMSPSGEIEVGLPAGQQRVQATFNAYDFLAGTTGGLPTRKFSPS